MSDKLLTVKEFDVITCNPEYKKDKYLKYLSEKQFKEFDEFIRKQTPEENEDAEAIDFFKAYAKKGVGDVIQAKNYVGIIQLESGYQIQVLPKIDFVDDDNPELSTSRVFINMLRCMKDFPGKVFSSANLRTESMNIYEIFINMYIQQVSELTRRGLKSAYIRVEDNLNFYKGKLMVSEHIKKNMAHKERFYVAFDEFHLNRPENRIIKATLLKLQKISNSSENVKIIRQLLTYFELVEPSTNYIKDFSKVVIDRNTKGYEDIMIWSKVFLMNKSFSTFSGDTNARALLFPMEKVYESFVAQNMVMILGESGWDVSMQDRKYYLFEEDDRYIFALRPDIVVTRPDGHKIVLDTKWKRLNNNRDANYGISQADMYQMFAYAKKYNTSDIWLLYPMTEEMKNSKDIVFHSYGPDGDVTVSVFFVDVVDIEKSLARLKEKLEVDENVEI